MKRKSKGGGREDDKHDKKAVEDVMLAWKPGSRVLPDEVADNILLQRKILMLEDAIKATTERPRYPYNKNGLESFQERREYPNSHTESLHAVGKSVKLAVTKTEGSDAPERSGDSDYQKVMVAFSSPPDYDARAPKWLAGKDFVKNHPFLIGDIIYISAPSPNKEKYEQVLGKITNFEEKFIPYTEIPEGAIANMGVGTSLVPYIYDESWNKLRNERGQPIAKYHGSVAEDMWTDPEHAAIAAEERAKNPPGMYVLEISYDSNRPPGDSGLIDKYNAFLYRNERGVDFDYYGYGPYNAAQAYVYTKLADRRARLKELKAELAKGKRQKRSIPDDGSGAGPGKVKGGRKKTRKHRRGGGDRDESVQGEMSGWQPGFDHPDQSVPYHVLQNITEHLQAQEEANPRYRFPYPPRVFKQTMDKVEEPPSLCPPSFPPPPKLSEEEKNNMIIQHYTPIPDSGKTLPIEFIVSENPDTDEPFKVTYDNVGREKVIYLKAIGDIAWWDESWSNPKKFHQSFKFPRPEPVLDTPGNRVLDHPPAYDDRRGDILVAIDPFSTRDDKVIAEIGEVTRFPLSCDRHRMYTTHCFKIFFKTPKELDFTSGQPAGERRRPYELTLPPQTVIKVVRGRKTNYPPITPRETFRAPPKGGKNKKHKTRRQKKKRGKKTQKSSRKL